MTVRNLWTAPLLVLLVLLNGCVGGTFSNKGSLEEYPLRPANLEEAKDLKSCLKKVHAIQDHHWLQTGHYYRKIRELLVDDVCRGYQMAMHSNPEGFEALAQFNESETTVRWSVNQTGTIEEHLEGISPDEDLLDLD